MNARLLVIDDHPLFVDGFAMMLRQARPAWTLVCGYSAADAERLLAAPVPADGDFDLIIIDIQLPDHDGFEVLAMIAAACPAAPRLIISGREDGLAQLRARQLGAKGFIVKSAPPAEILASIERILAGETVFLQNGDGAATNPRLTTRQTEVLGLLAAGCANKEIRYRLDIAERTVRAHLTELFGILGANSRVQAILRARQLGLID